jgi:hypothetical protein
VARIITERRAGTSWSDIGRSLDADAIPTAQGGSQWYPSTVRSVYLANIHAA